MSSKRESSVVSPMRRGAGEGMVSYLLYVSVFCFIFLYMNFLSGKLCVIFQAELGFMISLAACASLCFYTELNSSCLDL